MLKARTYILKPEVQIKCKEDLGKNYSNYFVDLNNKKEIEKIKAKIDTDYIDGYIYLEYGGRVILNYELWDLVDQLWAYFLNLIEDFLENNAYAESSFPDQPIDIKIIKHLNGYVLFCITPSEGEHCFAWPIQP